MKLRNILKHKEGIGTENLPWYARAVQHNIVIGPTADDDTKFCLRAYFTGAYGQLGSQSATAKEPLQ